MKKYIRASEKISQEVVDSLANECVEMFAEHGFEMSIRRADPSYSQVTICLRVESVDGDSSIVYNGYPVAGGYAMNLSYWFGPSYATWYEDKDSLRKSIEDYVNRWLNTYEDLQQIAEEIAEIEPQLPEIRDEFLDEYANQFPGLTLDVDIYVWMTENVNGKFEYPLLYGGRKYNPSLEFSGSINGNEFYERYSYANWVSGEGEQKLVNEISKLYNRKKRRSGNSEIVAILKDHGIDTTKSKYELVAETYERYGGGRKYRKNFTCPGDYLAYFAMTIHATPNYNNLMDSFGDIYEFEEFVDKYPTVGDIAEHAASSWWGDGDDYIISLKDVNSGEVLYAGDSEPEEYSEEDEDWS